MNKNSLRLVFTESLEELLNENLTLFQSLKIIGASRLSSLELKNTAIFLSEQIEMGNLFSQALKKNPYVHFDSTYIAFVSFAESTGDLKFVMTFLKDREKRKKEAVEIFITAMTYPFCVVMLILGLSLGFWLNKEKVLELFSGLSGTYDIERTFIICFLVFLISSFVVIKILWELMSDDKICEAFNAGAFLYENGMSLPGALGMAARIAGLETKYGRGLISAKNRMECGMSLKEAFNGQENRFVQKKLETVFIIAEETGNKKMLLRKIASKLEQEKELKRKICVGFIEPVFILLVGVFLLSLVLKIILPCMDGIFNF